MISYQSNSRTNMKEYIAGHLYEDSKGVPFIFLGRGVFKSSKNFRNINNDSYFLILSLRKIKFILDEVNSLKEFISKLEQYNIDLYESIFIFAGPRPAIKDLGKIFDTDELLDIYEYSYKHIASDGTVSNCDVCIDFRENIEALRESF